LDDWFTDALPPALAAERPGPLVSPPDGAYPIFSGGFRAATSTESMAEFGRELPANRAAARTNLSRSTDYKFGICCFY